MLAMQLGRCTIAAATHGNASARIGVPPTWVQQGKLQRPLEKMTGPRLATQSKTPPRLQMRPMATMSLRVQSLRPPYSIRRGSCRLGGKQAGVSAASWFAHAMLAAPSATVRRRQRLVIRLHPRMRVCQCPRSSLLTWSRRCPSFGLPMVMHGASTAVAVGGSGLAADGGGDVAAISATAAAAAVVAGASEVAVAEVPVPAAVGGDEE